MYLYGVGGVSGSVVSNSFATPWTVAHQAPPPIGILQASILEWVAISFSRDLPNPGVEHESLLPCKQILYCLSLQGSPKSGQMPHHLGATEYEGGDSLRIPGSRCWTIAKEPKYLPDGDS